MTTFLTYAATFYVGVILGYCTCGLMVANRERGDE